MVKETTHRADELKKLGWSNDDIARYIELWDYRQRWGAINLERDDRLFLRKAEAALPAITTGKVSVKKPTQDKSYYRRLKFFLDAMNLAETKLDLPPGSRGVWPILLEEELRALDYYEPVLGLPDTIKAKALEPIREEIIGRSSKLESVNLQICDFDFTTPLEDLKAKQVTSWKPLREGVSREDQYYPVLSEEAVSNFREEVRLQILSLIREILPSLSDTKKPEPPDDWSRE
ncbi:hypothetical protein [Prochlorococcus sp. MIT 1307]|uniref:hypothetical protein n=1 Tax=Prochlorococcus sp. MIT 1307 TaxID=3096219 RepID=UPI002A76198F|nr:hypothetical protein [Prochlorococcus sp. MIT 1307]